MSVLSFLMNPPLKVISVCGVLCVLILSLVVSLSAEEFSLTNLGEKKI